MPIMHLIRHGQSTANEQHLLAGRTPGIGLTERGRRQTRGLAGYISALDPVLVAVSPLQRCQETAQLLAGELGWPAGLLRTEPDIAEVDYGRWAGRPLKEISAEPAWQELMRDPATFAFPGGETVAEMSQRACAAAQSLDREVERAHGAEAVWAVVSHGDIIQAILAEALGMPLAQYRRLTVSPASLSAVRWGPEPLVTLIGARPEFEPPRPPAQLGGA